MNITSAKYSAYNGVNVSINVVIDGETFSVPINPDNRHYQMILDWVAEGNTIEEAE